MRFRRFMRGLRIVAVLWAAVCLAQAQSQSTSGIPETPAGHALKAWLEAFNSGDQNALETYYRTYQPEISAATMMPFRQQTGGFDLLQILRSEPRRIEILVKEKNSETRAVGVLELAADSDHVTKFPLRAIPPGTPASNVRFDIDAATRSRVIDNAIAQINESYVSADVAKQMEDAVRARQKRGEYDQVTDGDAFASMLTDNFRAVSHDKHLSVNFSPAPLPDPPQGENPNAAAQYKKQMDRINCGFEKVEIMNGNVGYVKFNLFADPAVCGPTATAAMNFLGNVDALIFDLRENGGGDPKMIAYLSTYLFDKPTHLNDLWERKTDTTQQFWTLPYVPGNRLDGKPVFILTSKRTFSGAEEFSYNLKNLKRATIIGETTGGGAHPVAGHKIDDHFTIGVPYAKAINPISKTNWEGVGVEPDVKVSAEEALPTAQRLAAEKLRQK